MKKAIATGLVGLIALGGAGFAAPSAFAQDAEDDTTETTETTREERRAERRAERAERRAERRAEKAALLTDTLGISAEELQTARQDGQSLADIATAQAVDVQEVVDALVANIQARIDAKIASGDIDADRAAEKLDSLEERVTARVNGERGEGRRGGPRG